LFAAYLPENTVLAALQEEHAYELRHASTIPSTISATSPSLDADFSKLLKKVRQNGISDAVNLSVAGVSALAAPVFDESGKIVLSLTAIGPSAQFDVSLNGGIATSLKALGRDLSQRLGHRF
jgi:DNA-binding IclR family transcriptional regulator